MVTWTTKLQLCWWLPKFSTCETSERTSATEAGMGLALAAVGFVGIHTFGGWTRPESELPPQQVQVHNYCSPGTWPQWICASDLVKTTPESHQGQLPAYPQLTWDWEQCQQLYFVSPHNRWKGTEQSTFTGEQLQRRNTQWLLSYWGCSNPAYLTTQIRNTAKK